jgi:hypothetical protein
MECPNQAKFCGRRGYAARRKILAFDSPILVL